MDQLLNFALTFVLIYGYPVVVGVISASYFGVPLPTSIFILAAGSFATNQTLSLYILIPLVAITSIFGDLFGYYLGHRFGHLLMNRYTRKIGLSESKFKSLQQLFNRWESGFVFVTRWLITPLCIPVNLIAGINHFPLKNFLILVVIGEFLWASLYLYSGYLVGTNWISIQSYISDVSTSLTLIIIGIISIALGFKLSHQKRLRTQNFKTHNLEN